MSQSFGFDLVSHFTVGTIGEPGRRVFLLQVGNDDAVVTLKAEKQQIAALCDFIGTLVAELARPGHLPEDLELRGPVDVAWVAGSIAATYDEITDRVAVVVEEAEFADATEEADGVLRFEITREQAAAVAIRGTSLVEAGRPPCPLCGAPLDPAGHACPRTNGHRPPQQ
jgi:uncharacterized repeat protein (TIGR03847 family)